MKRPMKLRGLIALAAVFAAVTAHAEPTIRPALNHAVTQDTIATTICVPGWTKSIRAKPGIAQRLKLYARYQH